MRATWLVFICIGLISPPGSAQQNPSWDKMNWLIGEWRGEGSGEPGKGGGTFTFQFDLDRKVLVRKSHTEYPATEGKSKIVHDDLIIVYPGPSGVPAKAIYFDNEGHVISYSISIAETVITFLSEKTGPAPVFRLTYFLLDSKTINVRFEMSQDGIKFMTYVEGKCTRI